MPEDVKNQTPVTEPQPIGTTPPEPTEGEKRFTQAELDQIIKDRLAAEHRKAEAEKAKAAQKAAEEAAAKNQEWEKLADERSKQLEAANARLAEIELLEQKRAVAEKLGLPAILADRIRGKTPDEMEADAKIILKAIPPRQAPALNPTNPSGSTGGETDAQRRRRLGLGL